MAGSSAQGRIGHTAHQDRNRRRWGRGHLEAGNVVELAVVLHPTALPERGQDFEHLVGAGSSSTERLTDQVELIDKRASVGFNEGDVHPEGNPHFQLDPARMAGVAQALARRLAQIDPPQAAAYASRHAAWQTDWQQKTAQWQQRAAPLKGQRVVGQHATFAYLWQWLGIQQVADMEPKPGVPPTPSHLQAVLTRVQAAPPVAVVHTLYQDQQPAQWLVRQLGEGKTTLLALPSTVTDDGASATLDGWMDSLIAALLKTTNPR